MEDAIPDEEKSRRLTVLLEKQREIQKRRNQKHLNEHIEVMVESKNESRGQWMGRTSQNKTLNFSAPPDTRIEAGNYVQVRVTTALPNSLVGEMISSQESAWK